MKKIKLSKNKECLVDDCDFELYGEKKWHISSTGYAVRRYIVDGKKVTVRLHRLIANTPSEMFCDHINRNRLDNRKENLRNVSWRENRNNISVHKDNRIGERNIDFHKQSRKYRVRIQEFGKCVYLSLHQSLKDAIFARDSFYGSR